MPPQIVEMWRRYLETVIRAAGHINLLGRIRLLLLIFKAAGHTNLLAMYFDGVCSGLAGLPAMMLLLCMDAAGRTNLSAEMLC